MAAPSRSTVHHRSGDLALVAHFEGEASVLSIAGEKVQVVETVRIGDEKSRVARRLHARRQTRARHSARRQVIAVLRIDNGKVTDTKHDIPVGHDP